MILDDTTYESLNKELEELKNQFSLAKQELEREVNIILKSLQSDCTEVQILNIWRFVAEMKGRVIPLLGIPKEK